MATQFLALDLAGTVHNLALCEQAAGADVDSPGWLVRSRILRMHTWIASDQGPGDADHTEAAAAIRLWGIHAESSALVYLTNSGRDSSFGLARVLGHRSVILPVEPYVVSPRGLAPAVAVKDFRHVFAPALAGYELGVVRDAFVSMMELAADQVQAEGLEQDDSFLDRYAEVRAAGEQRVMALPVEVLGEPSWLVEAWRKTYGLWWGRTPAAEGLELVALRLRCAMGTPDHGFRAAMSPPRALQVSVPSGWHCQAAESGHLLCTLRGA